MIRARTAALLLALPPVLLYLSLFIGRFPVAPLTVWHILTVSLFGGVHDWPESLGTILFSIRLPRAAAALLIGGGLAVSGSAYQAIFRNPLVSPDILGVSAAAGFGAALAMILSFDPWGQQLSAFLFGLGGVALSYGLARRYRSAPLLMLVLSGVIVAAFFGALLSATKYVADPDGKLPAITYWLLGSLNAVSGSSLIAAAIPMVIGVAGLLLLRWRLNVLSMGAEEAQTLGLRAERMTVLVIICSTLISAAAVALAGIVGWVGLVIPHLARGWFGADHRKVLPASASIGAVYLLAIDDIARTAVTTEIPLGVLTALIGAPFFAYLIKAGRVDW